MIFVITGDCKFCQYLIAHAKLWIVGVRKTIYSCVKALQVKKLKIKMSKLTTVRSKTNVIMKRTRIGGQHYLKVLGQLCQG